MIGRMVQVIQMISSNSIQSYFVKRFLISFLYFLQSPPFQLRLHNLHDVRNVIADNRQIQRT